MNYSSSLPPDVPTPEEWQFGLIDPFHAGLRDSGSLSGVAHHSGTWPTFISLQPNAPPSSTAQAQGFQLPVNNSTNCSIKDPFPQYDGFFPDPASLPKEAQERVMRKVSHRSETNFEEAQERKVPSASEASTCSHSRSPSGARASRHTEGGKTRRQDDGGGRKCSNGKCKLRRRSGRRSEKRSRTRKHRSRRDESKGNRRRRDSTARNRRESNKPSRHDDRSHSRR